MTESPAQLSLIDVQIADREARLKAHLDQIAKHDREISKHEQGKAKERHAADLLTAELSGLRWARQTISSQPAPQAAEQSESLLEAFEAEGMLTPTGRKKRGFRIDQPWDEILRAVVTKTGGLFDYDDVIKAGRTISQPKEILKPSCRTQILGYKNKGFIEAVQDGIFRLTAAGLKEIGLRNDEGPADAGPSRSVAGLAGSPLGSPTQLPVVGSTPTSSSSSVLNGSHSRAATQHAISPGGPKM